MPRYVIEIDGAACSSIDAAVQLAERGFPEVAVEEAPPGATRSDGVAVLLCRAPSAAHLHRWAAAAELTLASLYRFDAAPSPRSPQRHAAPSDDRAPMPGGKP